MTPDPLVFSRPTLDPAGLARASASLRAELSSKRVPSWRTDAFVVWGSCLAVAGVVAAVLTVTGNAVDWFAARGVTVLGLCGVALVSVWAAIAPGRAWVRVVATILAVLGAAGVVVTRALVPAGPSHAEWVCFVSHLGGAVIPFSVAVAALRRMAPRWTRAAVAGAGVGTVGAMMGELGCSQGWQHVLLFHVGAWCAVVLALVVIQRFITVRSHAP